MSRITTPQSTSFQTPFAQWASRLRGYALIARLVLLSAIAASFFALGTGLVSCVTAPSAPILTVGKYRLVAIRHARGLLFDYTYKASVTNSGTTAAVNVTATIKTAPTNVTVIDGSLSFGDVAAGASVRSRDTFTIRKRIVAPFNPNNLVWTIGQHQNLAPTAEAGPDQTVALNATARLDGSASSDPDGDPLTYQWTLSTKPAGSAATLSGPTAVNPTFVVDKPGTFVASLTVKDGALMSPPDTVTITTANSAPVAEAGADQTVKVGTTVQLDGSGSSDVDGNALTYRWELTSRPTGSTAALTGPTSVNPTFPIDKPGTYSVDLIVNDAQLDSEADVVLITTENSAPVAEAGADQSVLVNTTVQLDGSGSTDIDGDALSYTWALVTKPTGSQATLSDLTAIKPTFTVDKLGTYIAQLIVHDPLSDSAPDTVTITTLNSRPVADAGPDQTVTAGTEVILDGRGSNDADGDNLSYRWAILSAPTGSTAALDDTAIAQPRFTPTVAGLYVVQLMVNDGKVDSDPDTMAVTVTEALVVVPDVVGLSRAAAEAAITGANLVLGTVTEEASDTVPADQVIRQNPSSGTEVARGSAVDLVVSSGPSGGPLPPDPSTVAPPVEPGVATSLSQSTEFLYTGPNPIQTGVAPGTIDPVRAAVLRGRVLDKNNQPLPGVTITVLSHPELGQTSSRADGRFDLVVNGGGLLTVNYRKDGYLSAQRQINAVWQDYALTPDVVLIPVDSQVTTLDLTAAAPMQVARGSVQTDTDGRRQATLLFPQGTQAEMVMPDGSRQPITTLSVRATEFTVGPNGPETMPAELPPTSAYTYAAVFTADEAKAAGAKDVVFAQPIPFYVENFLNFPIGVPVPLGAYDPDKGVWVASDSGRVIKILSIASGLAELDTDGDGAADNGAALRRHQRGTPTIGRSLQCWPEPLADADPPFRSVLGRQLGHRPAARRRAACGRSGARRAAGRPLRAGRQLGHRVPEPDPRRGARGGRHPLRAALSERAVPGARRLEIPLSGSQLPPGVRQIELEIRVAGQIVRRSFAAAPNQRTTFTWDGKDAYGRTVQGRQPITVRIGYTYGAVYGGASRFGYAGGPISITGVASTARGDALAELARQDRRLGRAGQRARRLDAERAPRLRSGRGDPLPGRRRASEREGPRADYPHGRGNGHSRRWLSSRRRWPGHPGGRLPTGAGGRPGRQPLHRQPIGQPRAPSRPGRDHHDGSGDRVRLHLDHRTLRRRRPGDAGPAQRSVVGRGRAGQQPLHRRSGCWSPRRPQGGPRWDHPHPRRDRGARLQRRRRPRHPRAD